MNGKERKSKPVSLSGDEIKMAAQGKSEQVMGTSEPVPLSEDEIKMAAQGKSEQVRSKKDKK